MLTLRKMILSKNVKKYLFIGLVSASIIILQINITQIRRFYSGYGGLSYASMALKLSGFVPDQRFFHEPLKNYLVAPFIYRIFTPLVVSIAIRFVSDVEKSFWIINWMALWVTMFTLGLLICEQKWSSILFNLFLISWTYPFRKTLNLIIGVDPIALCCLSLAFLCLTKKKWLTYSLIMLIGALNKETQLLILPVHYVIMADQLFDRKALRSLIWAIPCVVIIISLRLFIPVEGKTFTAFYFNMNEIERVNQSREGLGPAFLTFGTLWILAIWQSIINFRERISLVFWTFLGATLITLIFATDTRRMLMMILPVLFVQASCSISKFSFTNKFIIAICVIIPEYSMFFGISRLRFSWLANLSYNHYMVFGLLVVLLILLNQRKNVINQTDSEH